MSYKLYFQCSGENGGNRKVAENDNSDVLVDLAESNPADWEDAYIDDSAGICIWHSALGYCDRVADEPPQESDADLYCSGCDRVLLFCECDRDSWMDTINV